MKRKLTPKQQRFADEYIKSGNAADAARKAGYKENTARVAGAQNLTKLNIKKYIDEQMNEIASKRIMDATEAVELLTSIARGETKETVYIGTAEGVYEKHKEADLKTRISATKEILKRYPDNDKLVEQQIRKLKADVRIATAKARIVEHQADELEGAGRINPLLSALAKGAQRLVSEEEEYDANTDR
ncbi:terminase [Lactiplantibacillus plantarum]|nr:terminase small subunit [Lactiplantibacillus plantarum]KIN20924.1 terminase [Lactiplantibacillus plantarum]